MAIQAPVLGGTTLAATRADDGYMKTPTVRGGSLVMADGSVRFENVQSGVKYEFKLAWDMLTDSQVSDIITAFNTLLTSYSSNNFTDVQGNTYTVTRYPDQSPEFTPQRVYGAALRWKAELKLREV